MSTLVTLNLAQGEINGEKISISNEESYYKFFGIPYAKSPIGDLRFKNPQPLEKFPYEPYDGTKEGNHSLQINPFTKEIAGSEDCLYLNIQTPEISINNPKTKFPVMVWIHGGAFMTGYGNRHILYPKHLIKHNIILVTVNYRLGALGFLSLQNGGISGNFGLKDQQMALKWIQDNIYVFNGDSNNVTLFGQSAGSAAIHMHLLSIESRKYFHKVICQSGLATMEWAIEKNSEEKSIRLAEILGFKGGDANETANFLQNIENPTDIILKTHMVLSSDEKRNLLRLPFPPVVENENFDNPFLTKDPIDIMSMENIFENIPVIMGYTSMEGIMLMVYTTKSINEIESDLGSVIPTTVYDSNDPKFENIITSVRNFYFNGGKITNENLSDLCQLAGDISFVNDFYKTVELHTKYQTKSPLYCFKFSYDGNLNYYKKRYNFEHVKGACHGDEIYYLFYPNEAAEVVQPDDNDMKMIKRMCKLWSNFAKYGNPTPKQQNENDDDLDFIWNPTVQINNDTSTLQCLDININCEMKQMPDLKRVQFWENLLHQNEFE